MKSKKGAIELSVTTIIVIVIGITLLVLGLGWVRGIFNDLDTLTVGAFDKADAAISELGSVDGPLTVSPNSISVAQGGAKTVQVIIANFEEEPVTFQGTATSSSDKVVCAFGDTQTETSKEYTLDSGQQAEILFIVDEKGGPLGIKTCSIEVSGITGDNIGELVIEVTKK